MTQLRFELGALEFEVTDARVQPSLIGLAEIRRGALRSVHAQVAVDPLQLLLYGVKAPTEVIAA